VIFKNEEEKLKNSLYSIFLVLIEFLYPTEDLKNFLKATLKEKEIYMNIKEEKNKKTHFIMHKFKIKEICFQILSILEPLFINN
jgi:hypothetical protein